MPSAPKIRKEILHILEEHIIPALRQQEILQVLAAPPFDFSNVEHRTVREELLPDNDQGPLQVQRHWPEEGLVAVRGTNLSFCFEGIIHRKIGVISSIGKMMEAQGQTPPPGITILKAPSPSVVVTTAFIAREAHPAQPPLDTDTAKTCSLIFERNEMLLFHSSRNPQKYGGSHHLSIQDTLLEQLGALYLESLQQNTVPLAAQAILLAIALRLQYHLTHTKPGISNSCWLDPASELEFSPVDTESKHQALCREVIDYIQNHLHLPLSIDMIAKRFHVSAFHLNRVFKEVQHTTVMRYVTDLRIKTAKHILSGNREQIKEVAQLVGFTSVTSFCTVFRRHTGLTPNQYRKMYKK